VVNATASQSDHEGVGGGDDIVDLSLGHAVTQSVNEQAAPKTY